MALTESIILPIGSEAPLFVLPDVMDGKSKDLIDLKGNKGTLILFICAHCPYVKHIEEELSQIAKDYKGKGISTIAISSNDVKNYPDDAPEKLKEQAVQADFIFPYLYDETQEVAKCYDAACTPDFYVYDSKLRLYYHGRLDNSTPKNGNPVTGKDLREALDLLLQQEPAPQNQFPSMGCNIKWKK